MDIESDSESGIVLEVNTAKLQWAKLNWPTRSIRSLGDVIESLPESTLQDEIRQLDKLLYARKSVDWNEKKFWEVFKNTDLNPPPDPKGRPDSDQNRHCGRPHG